MWTEFGFKWPYCRTSQSYQNYCCWRKNQSYRSWNRITLLCLSSYQYWEKLKLKYCCLKNDLIACLNCRRFHCKEPKQHNSSNFLRELPKRNFKGLNQLPCKNQHKTNHKQPPKQHPNNPMFPPPKKALINPRIHFNFINSKFPFCFDVKWHKYKINFVDFHRNTS